VHFQESGRRPPAAAKGAKLKWLGGVTPYGAVGVVDTDRTMYRANGGHSNHL
jgi:hypothetical protein